MASVVGTRTELSAASIIGLLGLPRLPDVLAEMGIHLDWSAVLALAGSVPYGDTVLILLSFVAAVCVRHYKKDAELRASGARPLPPSQSITQPKGPALEPTFDSGSEGNYRSTDDD